MADIVVRAVKIKKRNINPKKAGDTDLYKLVAKVKNDINNSVKTVSVVFSSSKDPLYPVPNPNPVTCIDEDSDGDFVYKQLTFSSDAVGYTFSVVATMYDANGKTIGTPAPFSVVAEDPTADEVL